MYSKAYFDDAIVPVGDARLSVASSAVLYGLSVYTVLAVCVDSSGGLQAFRLADHYQRLINSAKIIGITTFEESWTFEQFKGAVQDTVSVNKVSRDVYVRVTVHVCAEVAGTVSRGLPAVLSMFVYDAQPILSPDGSRLKTSSWRRTPDCSIPSRAKVNGAYVNSVLAKQDAIDSGYDDCIFLDTRGHVCELSAANIFMVKDGILVTPDTTSDLLEGINRKTVLEIAREDMPIEVQERTIDMTELYIADEVFASGTSVNIAPVLEIDSRVVGSGAVGVVTKQLQTMHHDMRHGKITAYMQLLTEMRC